MTPSELRAAAEREIESLDDGSLYAISQPADGHCYCVQQRTIQTLESMARHILATVRDDDKFPVTVEWWKSVGAESDWGCLRIHGDEVSLQFHDGVLSFAYRSDEWSLIRNPTRGQVRDLCRVLGIELKEQL